ncbi:MAG: 23S rRNA (uracil(1939)-C(5))-methyltransferase RlmD [Betaproteobacteria bacterium]|nr:23S rRNA (uracil(1939)-C(5))-methyltransferase RlmD [Betaproteobacteria bacterium]
MTLARVESLEREGRGVAHVDGKTVFIDGALPGEIVEFAPYRSKASFDFAQLVTIRSASAARVSPRCPHFGVCGGCSLQHFDDRGQVAAKQRTLEDALWHIGRVRADTLLPPIHGPVWRYRHRARLSARMVEKKGGVLVGFRERKSTYVADMKSCEVLPAHVSAAIPQLRELIAGLSVRDRVPQIEVAIGDSATVLVLRILEPLDPADHEPLRRYAEQSGMHVWLQPRGPDSAAPFWPPDAQPLYYSLPEFAVRIAFSPADFTQVNPEVNRMLVRRAVGLLAPMPGERIADFFCGLGNFSLPLARAGASVTGFEGSARMLAQAQRNADANGLTAQCRFQTEDLFDRRACARLERFDKALIDPPREGAVELVKSFPGREPSRILYVSCDPATLARDAGVLVHTQGYTLAAAGIANMFPHTAHVESMALFEREANT